MVRLQSTNGSLTAFTKCEDHRNTAMGVGKHTQWLLPRQTSERIRTGIEFSGKYVSQKLGPATVLKKKQAVPVANHENSKHDVCNLESPTSEGTKTIAAPVSLPP